MLGWAFMRAGDYPTAVQTQLQARHLAVRVGYVGGIIHADNELGYAYAEQGNYLTALGYYRRASQRARQRHDFVLLTPILGNIGQAYQQLGQADSARRYVLEGYAFDLRFRDRHSEIGDLSLLGDVEASSGNAVLARRYYQQSIARARSMPVSYALCRSWLGLARLASQGGQSDQALAYGHQALRASRLGGYAKGVFEASSYLATIYSARGEPGPAYRSLAAAVATRDSLFGKAKMAQVQALAFGEQMRQQALAEKRLDSVAAQRQRLLLAGLMTLAVAAGFAYLLLNRRQLRREVEFARQLRQLELQRAQAVLAAEELERRRIGADLHDGVGQLLTAAKLNLYALGESLCADHSPEQCALLDTALSVVDEGFREVRNISHNLLPNALQRAGLVPAVRDFLHKTSPDGHLHFSLSTLGLEESSRLAPEVEAVLYRVIQELVQNIVKHAAATEVTLHLGHHAHEFTLLVEDNGVGFEPGNLDQAGGIGLKNIASRVAYLGGRVHFDGRPGHGTSVSLEIPVPNTSRRPA